LTYFTQSPFERMMVQRPQSERKETRIILAADHPCHGCKRYGQGCIKPCYRDLQTIPKEVLRKCVL